MTNENNFYKGNCAIIMDKKSEEKNGPITVHLLPTVVNALCHWFVAFHRILILWFQIALIVTKDSWYRVFHCEVPSAIRSNIVTSRIGFKFKGFSVVVAVDQNTSYPDIVCWHSPENEEDRNPTYPWTPKETRLFRSHQLHLILVCMITIP